MTDLKTADSASVAQQLCAVRYRHWFDRRVDRMGQRAAQRALGRGAGGKPQGCRPILWR